MLETDDLQSDTEGSDQNDGGGQDDGGWELQPFMKVWERAVSVLRSAGNDDEVAWFEFNVNAASDLIGEEARTHLHALRTTRGYGSQVAADLQKHVDAQRERLDELQRQAEAGDREERKKRLVAEREEAARLAAEKQRDAELLDEIEREAAEAAARATGLPIQDDLEATATKRITTILEKVDRVRSLPFGEEQNAERESLELLTAAPRALADTMSNPKLMAAERADAWEQADPETRELASQMYGIGGVFDVDVDSPDYRDGLEAAKKKAAENEAWINEQTTAGRS